MGAKIFPPTSSDIVSISQMTFFEFNNAVRISRDHAIHGDARSRKIAIDGFSFFIIEINHNTPADTLAQGEARWIGWHIEPVDRKGDLPAAIVIFNHSAVAETGNDWGGYEWVSIDWTRAKKQQ
ncbi:hypothetical protein BSQ40_19200 [Serratia fonticola]|nr:hypothetical protein BSQ40_19200 [Serratia fonticola]